MATTPPSDGSPASAGNSPAPQVIVQQQPQKLGIGLYGKIVTVLLIVTVMSLFSLQARYEKYFSPSDKPQEQFHSLSESAQEKIAIITLSGTILEGDSFAKKQIERVRDDGDVVAVVLRVDSPGGTVTGSDYLYHHLKKLREDEKRKLPLVVSMGSMCASGGYYVSMAVGDEQDVLFAEPTTWTGSIGVVIPHYDLSGLLANYNVRDDSIVSHKDKLMGSPTRVLDAEERAEERKLLQELVNVSFGRFKEIVRAGRPKLAADEQAFDQATTGQIFTAEQALDLGMIDRIGFLEKAIERAAELADRDPEKLRCIEYKEPQLTINDLLSAESQQNTVFSRDLSGLLNLTAPRAYYLCTWLPAVLSNSR